MAKANASALRAAAGGAGQELEVGAAVGLHRARDVAQHHQPPADDAPAPARQADRVAAGAQAAPAGSAACRCAGRGGPSRSGACAAAGWRAPAATSAGRAARARAGSSASKLLPASTLLVARHRQRDVHLGAVGVRRRPPGGDGARPRAGPPGRLAGRARVIGPAARRAARRRSAHRRRCVRLGRGRAAEDRAEDLVEGLGVGPVGDEHRAGGPVEPPAAVSAARA